MLIAAVASAAIAGGVSGRAGRRLPAWWPGLLLAGGGSSALVVGWRVLDPPVAHASPAYGAFLGFACCVLVSVAGRLEISGRR